jgi:hypothetical protein
VILSPNDRGRAAALIIVEGPDGSGKTSLVNSLKSMLGLQQAKKAVDPDMRATTPIKDYVDLSLALPSPGLLYDRFYLISAPIYGPLCGMVPPNDLIKNSEQFEAWLSLFRTLRPIIIYCLPPIETVDYNLHHGPVGQAAQAMQVWDQAYWAYWSKAHQDLADSSFTVRIYDYTKDQPRDLVDWLGGWLGRRH